MIIYYLTLYHNLVYNYKKSNTEGLNMPIINVTMTHEDGGATKEQKERLAKELTDTFVNIFGRGEKSCVVTISEVSIDNYAIGGETITNIRQRE